MVTEDGDSRFDEAKEERQTEGYTNINDEWKRETPPVRKRKNMVKPELDQVKQTEGYININDKWKRATPPVRKRNKHGQHQLSGQHIKWCFNH